MPALDLQILEKFHDLRERRERAVLATVVRTSGSTYRKEGAKLLIPQEGEPVGSISAGCLEADVREIAKRVRETGVPELRRYDNSASDDLVWGLGIGCNGVVEVLVEPITEKTAAVLATVEACVRYHRPVAVATLVCADHGDLRPGARMLVHSDDRVERSLGLALLDEQARVDAKRMLAAERSRSHIYFIEQGEAQVFIEAVWPPRPLVVVGADPDAAPIVALGRQMGFRVVLVDHREAFANPQKYPEADETVVSPREELARAVEYCDRTFVLIKTHNYLDDKQILRVALQSPACYVGQLGPRSRTDDLLRDLSKEGVTFSADQLARLYAPAGLDIGAQDADQIAVSILAEMRAVLAGRVGGSLRQQIQPIHPRS